MYTHSVFFFLVMHVVAFGRAKGGALREPQMVYDGRNASRCVLRWLPREDALLKMVIQPIALLLEPSILLFYHCKEGPWLPRLLDSYPSSFVRPLFLLPSQLAAPAACSSAVPSQHATLYVNKAIPTAT